MRNVFSRPFIQDGWSTAWDASPLLCIFCSVAAILSYFGGMALAHYFSWHDAWGIAMGFVGALLTAGIGLGLVHDVIAPRFGTWYVEEDSEEQVDQ